MPSHFLKGYVMRLKKIVLSLCLIIMIAFNQTYDVYADAGSLVVAGGAIGVAGVGVAGITGPVVVAVFVGLMAFGLNVELTKASEEAGMTKTQFVKSKIEQYCNEANIAKETFGSYILSEAEVFNDGRIKLSDQAAQMIKRFGNWLFDTNSVASNPSASVPDDGMINVGDNNLFKLTNGYKLTWSGTDLYWQFSVPDNSNVGVTMLHYPSGAYSLLYISPQMVNVSVNIWPYVTETNYLRYQVGNYDLYYDARGLGSYALPPVMDFGSIPVFEGTLEDFIGSMDGTFDNVGAGTADDTFTGSRDDWASGNPALDPAQDQSLVVNPDLINSIPIPADKDLTWDVNSYLDALEKALDKTGNPDVPAVDDATGLPVSIPIPDTITLDPTAERVDNPDLPSQKTPVIDPNKQPEGEQAVDPLKFDLKNIFPFCLPWDIKDMLNLLKASPQAPSYRVDWHIPIINTDLEFTVDLSPFNSVAAVARKMELLAFIIGLAVITRRLIRG